MFRKENNNYDNKNIYLNQNEPPSPWFYMQKSVILSRRSILQTHSQQDIKNKKTYDNLDPDYFLKTSPLGEDKKFLVIGASEGREEDLYQKIKDKVLDKNTMHYKLVPFTGKLDNSSPFSFDNKEIMHQLSSQDLSNQHSELSQDIITQKMSSSGFTGE